MQSTAAANLDLLNGNHCVSAGHYEARLAQTSEQIAEAQALRYRVFYQENQGQPTAEMVSLKREVDEWDAVAYHIIVTDRNADGAVVGTLRLVSNRRLAQDQQFYTEKTFDLSKLRKRYRKILELSRYCIDSNGRSGTILMLIWKFAMRFIMDNRYQLMVGCASFPGADIEKHQSILSYLYQHNLAPSELLPEAIVSNSVKLDQLAATTPDNHWEGAKKAVPSLLRGYLKLGAKISDTAIIDPQFNTVFVSIYVDAEAMFRDNHTLVPK